MRDLSAPSHCLYLQDAVGGQSPQQVLVLLQPALAPGQPPLLEVQVVLVSKDVLMQRCSGCVRSL